MEFFAWFVFWRIGKDTFASPKQEVLPTEMEGISKGGKRIGRYHT